MRLGDTIDHDVYEGTVADQIGRNFMEIGGQDTDLFLKDSPVVASCFSAACRAVTM